MSLKIPLFNQNNGPRGQPLNINFTKRKDPEILLIHRVN